MSEPRRVLIISPNWLGDTVMALPAIADVRRRFPDARLAVAARAAVADLFGLVPFIDEVVTLQWGGGWWQRARLTADATRLQQLGADVALLLPNSFAAAWLVKQAAIPERWGYRSDMRTRLLTRSVPRPKESMHQGAYYQHLTRALGLESGPLEPTVTVPESAIAAARALLGHQGWDGARPVLVFAPGAAYGNAKRWIPAHVARSIENLVVERKVTCVLAGGRGDAATARHIVESMKADVRRHVIDVTGQTRIEELAGVFELAQACVANDSGAMHVAAAVGAPVVALFGPTREHETAPLTRPGHAAEVLTHSVWCRPCMLRECPLDHRCMKGIPPERVVAALARVARAS